MPELKTALHRVEKYQGIYMETSMGIGEALDILDGVMLSDGSITRDSSEFHMNLSGWCHVDWLLVVGEALAVLGCPTLDGYPMRDTRLTRGKPYEACDLHTHTNLFLRAQRARWYSDSTKIVPRDVQVTPVSLAHWYTGDGSSTRDKRPTSFVVGLKLSSLSFTECENYFLRERLHNLGITASVLSVRSRSMLFIDQWSVNLFMDIVEPYMVPSYLYKIKRRLMPPSRKPKRPAQSMVKM